MRKVHKNLLVTASLTAPLALASCGKKDKSDDDPATTTAVGTVNAPGTGTASNKSVVADASNSLTIGGTLALDGLSLTDSPDAVLAFNMSAGSLSGKPVDVAVDAAGNFSAPVARGAAAADELLAILAQPRASRDLAHQLEVIGQLQDIGGATVDDLRNYPEDKLQAEMGGMAKRLKEAGQMTMLVAYVKSDDKVAEAQSFRFIGLPTTAGRPISGMPNNKLVGNMNLGKISGAGADVQSELSATDAFSLSAEAQATFADLGSTLKAVKNVFMNDAWSAEPFYVWNNPMGGRMDDALDKFADASAQQYHGYGFYVKGPENDPTNTLENLCGGQAVTFTPPSVISVVEGGSAAHDVTAFSNAGGSISSQGDSRICGASGYYAREDIRDGQKSFMLNFGTGGGITSSPAGLWRLAIGGTEVARFDFNTGSPVVDGKPVVFLQSPKFTSAAGKITGVEVELYHWDGTTYAKVTDLAPVKAMMGEMSCSVGRRSDNGESRTELTVSDAGVISGAFDSSRHDDDNGPAINPPVDVADAQALACYYAIGTSNYRVEYRNH